MSDLPPRPGLLAVEVQVGAGNREGPRRSGRRPIRFTIAGRAPRRRSTRAGARRRPGGGSRTGSSRRPRSSSGPELCTRGAISLPSSVSPTWNSSIASTPTWSEASPSPRARAPRRAPASAPDAAEPARASAAGSRRGAGSRRAASTATSPSGPRTATIDSSRSNGTNASHDRRAPRRSTARRPRHASASRITAWPLPS